MLTYDAVSFHQYLDTILAAHSAPPGSTKLNYSPWLFEDAAHILFQTAKSRVYRQKSSQSQPTGPSSASLPDTLEPTLEEQPKWNVLAEILVEIEQDMYQNPITQGDSNNSILIMCSDQQTCRQIREYLDTMHLRSGSGVEDNPNKDEENGDENKPSGEYMMQKRLRGYIQWKRNLPKINDHLYGVKPKQNHETAQTRPSSGTDRGYQSHGRGPPTKRRRIRGGGATASVSIRAPQGSVQVETTSELQEATLLETAPELANPGEDEGQPGDTIADDLDSMEDYYELYDMNDLLLVHAYGGDMDEHVLEETRPRYIIMYEPDSAFIRRVEVYRSSHTDRNVRVYFMYYGGSVEEQKYLSSVRREKDAFTKLIKEKGVCTDPYCLLLLHKCVEQLLIIKSSPWP